MLCPYNDNQRVKFDPALTNCKTLLKRAADYQRAKIKELKRDPLQLPKYDKLEDKLSIKIPTKLTENKKTDGEVDRNIVTNNNEPKVLPWYQDQINFPDVDLSPPKGLGNFTEINLTGDDKYAKTRLKFSPGELHFHKELKALSKKKKAPSSHVKYKEGIPVPWIDEYERGVAVPEDLIGQRVASCFSEGHYTGEVIGTWKDQNGNQ